MKGGLLVNFVSEIFETLGGIVSSFVTMLVSLFDSVVDIFYTPGTDGGAGELTIVGVLMLIGLGTGLVIWAFSYIRRLIRVRTN